MSNYVLSVRAGVKNHNAKLTEATAQDVYKRAWSGKETMQQIADSYGMHTSAVSRIKHRDAWFAATKELYQQRMKGTLYE